MKQIVIDAGPFIHLTQIKQIALLKKFPSICTPASVISEISLTDEIPIETIRKWKNLKIISAQEKPTPKVEKAINEFGLHPGEKDVLCLAIELAPSIVLTDDLDARCACESLKIEVHGTVGIIAYAYHRKWLTLKMAEESLVLLYRKSSLFITSAIIERAIAKLRKSA